MGPGGPPGGATYPGGPHGLMWEGNQPLVGWCAPPWAPLRLGLETLGWGRLHLPWGAVHPPGRRPPWRCHLLGTVPPETLPMAETALPIYNSSPPDHSGTPRDVQYLIRDSEQL